MSQDPFTRLMCGQIGYVVNWFPNWPPDNLKKYLLITKLGRVVRKRVQNAFKLVEGFARFLLTVMIFSIQMYDEF